MVVWKRFVLLLHITFCTIIAETSADSSLAVETGDKVSIWCLTPQDTTVFWQYQREPTSSDVFVCVNGNIVERYKNRLKISSPYNGYFLLTIFNVTANDTGIYCCTGNDGLDQAKQYTRISVRGRHTHSNETAAVGSSVQMQCRTTVQLRAKWIYQRREAETGTQITTQTHALSQKFALADVSHGDYTLVIRNVQLNDSGLYSCVEDGSSSHTVRLSIVYPDMNECVSSPCVNGGACVDGVNKYSCLCRTGFTGTNCDIDIDECQSNPCVNDGICVDKIGKYTCRCMTGFNGDNCENDDGHDITHEDDVPREKEDKNSMSSVAVGVIVAVVTSIVVGLIAVFVLFYWRTTRKNRSTVVAENEPLQLPSASSVAPEKASLPQFGSAVTYVDPSGAHNWPSTTKGPKYGAAAASNLEQLTRTWVNGLVVYEDYIIALRGRELQFYESSNYVMQRAVTVRKVYKHFRNDMVLRQTNSEHHLYITDYFNRNIYILALPLGADVEASEAEATWTVDWQPTGISVTLGQNILVTFFDVRKLIEFTPDGREALRTIVLKSDVEWPVHAVEIQSKTDERRFVVCHNGDVVKTVDVNGKTISSFYGCESDAAADSRVLALPCHIAVDEEDSCIYVADEFNDRVVSLSFELECEFQFVCRDVQRPRRLFLHGKRLYVGQWNGHLKFVDTRL